MPTLIFNEIDCIRPKEAKDDEVYFNLRTENIWIWRYYTADAGNALWGPETMEEGDLISLRDTIDPIEFHEFAHIQLWEDDRDPGFDNLIGEFTIRRPFAYFGNHNIWLPRGLFGPNHQCYRISYVLLEEPSTQIRNRIELLSLTCNDAQGTKDRVSLIVNNRRLWGQREMRTGDHVTFDNLSYDFIHELEIRLHDDRGEKWTDYLNLREGEYRINSRLSHVFARDRVLIGDYRYTLVYRMRRLPAS